VHSVFTNATSGKKVISIRPITNNRAVKVSKPHLAIVHNSIASLPELRIAQLDVLNSIVWQAICAISVDSFGRI
jgi:hypothetical protein